MFENFHNKLLGKSDNVKHFEHGNHSTNGSHYYCLVSGKYNNSRNMGTLILCSQK